MQIFSKRLKELRCERGISQKALADALGYTQSNVSEWEKGTVEPRLGAIKSIAAFFNVSSDFLLGFTDEENYLQEIPKDGLFGNENMLLHSFRALSDEGKELVLKTVKLLKR